MTTGRINQVTTVRRATPERRHRGRGSRSPRGELSPGWSFVSFPSHSQGRIGKAPPRPRGGGHTGESNRSNRDRLVPLDPARSKRTPLRPRYGTEIVAFGEDYQRPTAPERRARSRRVPEWVIDRQAWAA